VIFSSLNAPFEYPFKKCTCGLLDLRIVFAGMRVSSSASVVLALAACAMLAGCYVYHPPAASVTPAPPTFIVGPYPPIGERITELPFGYQVFERRGIKFYYHRGVYYQPVGKSYAVVRPPF
jgi:hypothetical protein